MTRKGCLCLQVAATPLDQHQDPKAAADADDACWVPISELYSLGGGYPRCPPCALQKEHRRTPIQKGSLERFLCSAGLSVNIAKVALEAKEKFFPCKKPL